MALDIAPLDTRHHFRPLALEFIDLLRELPPSMWDRPAGVGQWTVHDLVAHLLDTTLRCLSVHRDGHRPSSPSTPLADAEDFVGFINRLNASWVEASQRLSGRVLTEWFAVAALQQADFFELLSLDAPPRYAVSWAGKDGGAGWLDIGRDFTEQWHHQMQVRDALNAPAPSNPEWLRSVLSIAMCGLPHAYRDTHATVGASVSIVVSGASGGSWALVRDASEWVLRDTHVAAPTALITLSDDTAWRLLFNGLRQEPRAHIRCEGDDALLLPLLSARSVIV